MKRFQIFLAGAFIATGSLFAQSDNAEWQAGLAKMKELIQVNPAQASDEAGQLLKGKNKKNPELVVAVARAFLDAESYLKLKNIWLWLKRRTINLLLFLYWKVTLLLSKKMLVKPAKCMNKPFISIRRMNKHI